MLAVVAMLALVACSSSSGDEPAAAAVPLVEVDGLAIGTEFRTTAEVLVDEDGMRLCQSMGDSLPPACSGAQAEVLDESDDAELLPNSYGATRWSTDQLEVRGVVDERGIVVDELAAP